MDKENYAAMLRQMAKQIYGEERANSLQPGMQEMAKSLAVIAEFDIALEEEPAFFS